MSDKLKYFIDSNREDFDRYEPGDLWTKIDNGLKQQTQSTHVKNFKNMFKYGFGASALIIGTFMVMNSQKEKVENLEQVKSNMTYIVVSRNEGIVYKRVMKNNKLKNKLTLISDNTVFQPYTVNSEDVLEIWKAEMVMSKANTEQRWDVNQLASLVSNLQDQVSSLKRKMN